MEQRQMEFKMEIEKQKLEQATVFAQQVLEERKLDLEQQWLDLMKEGKIRIFSDGDLHEVVESGPLSFNFNVVANLRLMPLFNEEDVDTFFVLFERAADKQKCSETEHTLMLQCVLTSKAQRVYSALSRADSQNYEKVKSVVLKAYEMVPEAYHQKFRGLQKRFTQTHVKLVRELELCFTRWCTASAVESFEDLVNLLVLEQFKNMLPSQTAIYIAERKVSNVAEAAVLADEYEFIHKSCFDVG